MRPRGQPEGREVYPVRRSLMGTKVVRGKELSAGDVVKYREPKRVQGAEAQCRCWWTALC